LGDKLVSKILVIGDSCEDVYHYGSCERLAPEGPAPVFHKRETKRHPGMANNVLANLKSLGITEYSLITQRRPIYKTRFIEESANHLLLRHDTDDVTIKSSPILEEYTDKSYLSGFDAVIVSDYDKGFLNSKTLETISKNHPLTFLDTKKIIGDWAANFSFIKINQAEFSKLKEARPYMFMNPKSREWLFNSLIITRGPLGCDHQKINYSVEKVEIRDVAGAGDTFVAALASKFVGSKNIEESLVFANQCGTQVVQKKGVVRVQLPI
jgi:bifunctional ADP-heptose synthase (sugar kinase/adenylyltransferase)